MTKQEAKELTLEVWRYLRDHPEIYRKSDLPIELYEKINVLECACPLCGLFRYYDCIGCPLKKCRYDSYWNKWCNSNIHDNDARQAAAAGIVECVEAWEVEE